MSTIAENPASSASAISSSVDRAVGQRVHLHKADEPGRSRRDRRRRRGRERREAQAAARGRSGARHPLLPVGVGAAQVRDRGHEQRHRELVAEHGRRRSRPLDSGEHAWPQPMARVRLDVGA